MSNVATVRTPLDAAARALQHLAPGLFLSGAIALGCVLLGRMPALQAHGFSPLTLAIVVGMAIGNTLSATIAPRAGAGVQFSKQTLLRAGIVAYGLRLTIQDVAHVGLAGVAIDALVLSSTFVLACSIGRVLRVDRTTSMLIGAGSSICGAAAVMATEPVVKGRPEQVAVAVATVVVFGTLSIFLYPWLFALDAHLSLIPGGQAGFGVYAGSTIHEVAQVVAAARSIGAEAADTAVIAKMVRVMMLAPFLMMLSAWLARQRTKHAAGGVSASQAPRGVSVPWFAFGFVAVVLFNSLHVLPASVVATAIDADTFLLTMAMAALGLSTRLGEIQRAGSRPLLLAAILFGWLIAGGAVINHAVRLVLA